MIFLFYRERIEATFVKHATLEDASCLWQQCTSCRLHSLCW